PGLARPRRRSLAVTLALLAAALIALAALAAGGCRRNPQPERQPERLGAEAEWAWLLAAKGRLDAERAQLLAPGGATAGGAPAAATTAAPARSTRRRWPAIRRTRACARSWRAPRRRAT